MRGKALRLAASVYARVSVCHLSRTNNSILLLILRGRVGTASSRTAWVLLVLAEIIVLRLTLT